MGEKRSPRVLVIEDDIELCKVLRTLLEQSGFRVDVAYDGETGLALLRKNHPAVAMIDIVLPRLNGLEIIAEIIRMVPEERPKILVLTGVASDSGITDQQWCEKLNVDAYISKPADPKHIVEVVNQLLA
ncbi:two component transcriptional regulator, winged helix family [Candidatus Sumerlaea chitinivorans]|uniref:Two component transcriptional regulator, winged helix family n=1 Tax=Sumerlaea chitinivorans TaxID=2250252 RepID=A0A2Z4Y4S0_SUMC1|nr:two component transcriptional regulator, winged helix family [Candidatus Sumerlaea chitinivorans]